MAKKKLLTVTLTIVIMLCALFMGCVDKTSTSYIDEYYDKIENSMTMEMIFDMGEYGAYSTVMKVENNKTYQSAFVGAEPYFTEEVDGYIYTYTKQGASWVKDNGVVKDSEVTGNDEFFKLFQGENYEYNKTKEYFVLKDTVVIDWDGMALSNGTMQFKDDRCTVKCLGTMSGLTGTITLMFYDINNTTVTLPTVG